MHILFSPWVILGQELVARGREIEQTIRCIWTKKKQRNRGMLSE